MLKRLEILDSMAEEEMAKLRVSYREKLASGLNKARQYKGTESEYEDILKTLIELENWLSETFPTEEKKLR